MISNCQSRQESTQHSEITLILLKKTRDFKSYNELNTEADLYFQITDKKEIIFKRPGSASEVYYDSSSDNRTYQCLQPISDDFLPYLSYLEKYIKHKKSGYLIDTIPDNCRCELFGMWILIYRKENEPTKYFFFGCCGLPDSIYQLCNGLRQTIPCIPVKDLIIQKDINADEIAKHSYLILKDDFRKLELKFQVEEPVQPIKNPVKTR